MGLPHIYDPQQLRWSIVAKNRKNSQTCRLPKKTMPTRTTGWKIEINCTLHFLPRTFLPNRCRQLLPAAESWAPGSDAKSAFFLLNMVSTSNPSAIKKASKICNGERVILKLYIINLVGKYENPCEGTPEARVWVSYRRMKPRTNDFTGRRQKKTCEYTRIPSRTKARRDKLWKIE